MTAILFAGDWHGDVKHALWCFEFAQENGCEYIVQLGDYAMIWNKDDSKTAAMEKFAVKYGVTLLFLPGNHDNWNTLDALEHLPDAEDGLGIPCRIKHSAERTDLAEHVRYLGRVRRFEIGGCKFASLGGAYSIDKARRVEGFSWWPQEDVTPESIKTLGTDPVDVLLTHDASINTHLEPKLELAAAAFDQYYGAKAGLDSKMNRELVTQAVLNVRPKLHVHGHFHMSYTGNVIDPTTEDRFVTVGLDCNYTPARSVARFDTETLEIAFPARKANSK